MMKAAVRTRALPLTLALSVACFNATNKLWSAPVSSPVGAYGILLNQWPSSNTGNDKTSSLLGVLNFDGAGNVTATYTKVNVDFTRKDRDGNRDLLRQPGWLQHGQSQLR